MTVVAGAAGASPQASAPEASSSGRAAPASRPPPDAFRSVARFRLPNLSAPLTWTFMLSYIAFMLIMPITALLTKASAIPLATFWARATEPVALHAYYVTFSCAFVAAVINCFFGFILAWVLVRYNFPVSTPATRLPRPPPTALPRATPRILCFISRELTISKSMIGRVCWWPHTACAAWWRPTQGRKILDAAVDLPFALPTSVAGLTLATVYGDEFFIGQFLQSMGVQASLEAVLPKHTFLAYMVRQDSLGLTASRRHAAALRAYSAVEEGVSRLPAHQL